MFVNLCFIFEANAAAIRACKRPVQIVRRHAVPLPLVSHKIPSSRERSTTNVTCVPLRRRRDVRARVCYKIATLSKAFTADVACVEVAVSGEVRCCCCHSRRRRRHLDAVTRDLDLGRVNRSALKEEHMLLTQDWSPIIRTFLSSK